MRWNNAQGRYVGRFLLIVALLAGTTLAAQITDVSTTGDAAVDASTKGAVGNNPVRASLNYTVDPATGILGIQIHFPLPGGSRGPNLSYGLAYSSSFMHPRFTGVFQPPYPNQPEDEFAWQGDGDSPVYGWQETTPTLMVNASTYSGIGEDGVTQGDCLEYGPYIFTDSSGRAHDLGLVHLFPNSSNSDNLCQDAETDASQALDDGSLYAQLHWGSGVTVTEADGTRYFFSIYGTPTNTATKPYQVEDANGNIETINDSGSTETWTDAAGRTAVVITYQAAGEPSAVRVYDSGGTARTYTLSWGEASFNYTVPDPQQSSCGYPYCAITSTVSGSGPVLSGISLPDGTSYGFGYDATYGAVSAIALPTGGGASFVYGLTPLYESLGFMDPNGGDEIGYDDLAVTRETRSDGGVWKYAYASSANGPGWTSKTTTVTDPAGNTTAVTYRPIDLGSAVGGGANYAPRALELQRIEANSSGQTLRVVTTTYLGLLPKQIQTALADSPGTPETSEVDYTYNGQYQVTEEDDHDFTPCAIPPVPAYYSQSLPCAAGPLLRKTTRTYLNYTSGAPWTVDKPTSVIVQNGSGATLASTQTTYDSYPSGLATSNATQHDPAYVGSGYTTRGNPTSVARWVNTSNTWLTTVNSFDDAGNLIKTVDPAGNPTAYSFTDAWAQSSCAPATGQAASYVTAITNALNQTTTFQYNSCTGSMASKTEPNWPANTTWSWTYDLVGRVLTESFPDGGLTTNTYTDTPGAFTVQVQHKMSATQSTSAVTALDGFGRAVTQSALNGQGTYDRVDTTFDTTGRVSYRSYPCTESNATGSPTCSSAGDSFQFDGLSRPTVTTHSDGSTVLTSYAGRAVETQDEGNGNGARITRIAQSDALGHLTQVCEVTAGAPPTQGPAPASCSGLDIAGTGYLTSYTMDGLGNLLSVSQGSESRSFTWDTLSRLIWAQNAEVSTAYHFVYDADTNCPAPPNPITGELASRTDARGVRACYQWDPLHRMTQRSYSDGTTPTANFVYDQSAVPGYSGLTYDEGQLTAESTAALGATPATAEVFQRDPVGRVTASWQTIPSGTFEYQYGFDLDGNPLTSQAPVGAGLTTAFDEAGRPTLLQSSVAGSLYQGVSYNPRGEATAATIAGVAETRGFDALGRATAISDPGDYSWSGVTRAPDGNVTAAADSVNGNFSYTVNDLNQLTAAACTSAPCSGVTANYTFDRYGNRWTETGPATESLSFNAMNQASALSYDNDGDTVNDGSLNYVYDSESRITSAYTGSTTVGTYIYGAQGERVYETAGGVARGYLYGDSGQQLTVVDGGGNLIAGETYVAGRYLGTQTPSGFVAAFGDNLGTVRYRQTGETDTSWAFGEASATSNATSPIHFTGKPKDIETGLDYFGARYYSSPLGRFMTPDWSASPEAVPYATLANPQSLNLYAYVQDNPATEFDPDGHIDCSGSSSRGAGCQYIAQWNSSHGITTLSKRSGAPGVPVRLPNGESVADPYSPTGKLMSPTSDLGDVARAGRAAGAAVRATSIALNPVAGGLVLYQTLKADLGQNGAFDYQRAEFDRGHVQSLPQFRDVSNFNVGLYAERAGLSLSATLALASEYASGHSANYSPTSGLNAQTREFIVLGFQAGASGVYGH